MARLVIFGAGGIAKLAHFYFTRDSGHTVEAFVVDASFRQAEEFCGLPVCTTDELTSRYGPSTHAMFVAISYARMNEVRREKYLQMRDAGYELVSYVSPRATYLADRPPGDNAFILEDCTVQPFVTIGSNVILWSGSHVGHDSVIEDHCFVAPRVAISGNVTVGERSFLGVNATVRNGITIASGTLVGAGAIIMKDTRPGEVYLAPRPELRSGSSEDVKL